MNVSLMRRVAALLATLILALSMTACYQSPPTVITDPSQEESDPIPTMPPKEGQLTLSLLMGVMSPNMKWSQIQGYTHTKTDDTHATFSVADQYGHEATMNVVFDEAADTISEAILSYGEESVSVLTDHTLSIRTIMIAMTNG